MRMCVCFSVNFCRKNQGQDKQEPKGEHSDINISFHSCSLSLSLVLLPLALAEGNPFDCRNNSNNKKSALR